jgi:putative Ca2+/H+ antiporter (TMEM165/GDT1 family)
LKFWEKSKWSLILVVVACSEWGDKSQLAAIALAAKYDMLGVILGGCLAHGTCQILALALGHIVSKCFTERCLGISCGLIFLAFGAAEIISVAS